MLISEPDRPVLVVVAHPDDETLGAGATIHRLTRAGVPVTTAILVGDASERHRHPGRGDLRDDTLAAAAVLGSETPIFGGFPNIATNTVPHLDMVRFVEQAIESTGARTVITTHPGDINVDHRMVSEAAQAAARRNQRRPENGCAIDVAFMEVLSSTEWAYPGAASAFSPNTWVEVGPRDVQAKLDALACYRDVMRPFPHPRSSETLRASLAVAGSAAGVAAAERFQSVFTLEPLEPLEPCGPLEPSETREFDRAASRG